MTRQDAIKEINASKGNVFSQKEITIQSLPKVISELIKILPKTSKFTLVLIER